MKRDERRSFFRTGLSSLYLPFFDALCALLRPEWQPYSAYRTFGSQDDLYSLGRTKPGGRVTNARGGESGHNYGCASDWTFFSGEQLIWLDATDPQWMEYTHAVALVGLKSGASFGDINHNELKIDCDWKHVLIEYKNTGLTGAQNHIRANMSPKTPLADASKPA